MAVPSDPRLAWTAERIRALRSRLGWTQEDLARALRVVRGTVAGWECGVIGPPSGPATVLLDILEQGGVIEPRQETAAAKPGARRAKKSAS